MDTFRELAFENATNGYATIKTNGTTKHTRNGLHTNGIPFAYRQERKVTLDDTPILKA